MRHVTITNPLKAWTPPHDDRCWRRTAKRMNGRRFENHKWRNRRVVEAYSDTLQLGD